jgi:hypothetical protein
MAAFYANTKKIRFTIRNIERKKQKSQFWAFIPAGMICLS